jgi:SAM-dependent methyltransferase
MPELDQYFLGYRMAEQERLRQQALELAPESQWLFDQIGIRHGERVVEVGCGPQGCLDLLSERVGATGSVVGVERSEDAVKLAREFVTARKLTNVEVLNRDARATGLPRGAFDLATARLVLANIPRPEEVVAEMVALVRPRGVIAFHEVHWTAQPYDPPLPAWDRLSEALFDYAAKNGIDLAVGKRVPRMLREAGLLGIQVRPLISVFPPGHSQRGLFPFFVGNLRDRLIEQHLIDKDELDARLRELWQHVDDPNTLILSNMFFQVWGRKPE